MHRIAILFVMLASILLGGCTRLPDTGVTLLRPAGIVELQRYLLDNATALDQFRLRGPFGVAIEKDRALKLSAAQQINTDLYLTSPAEKTALVIILHGYASSKDDHAFQAMQIASWGMHCLVLQLPNDGPWSRNGRTVAEITRMIYNTPEIIDRRVDPNKIILIGHSFGASAMVIALSAGAPAIGAILLDPAAVGRDIPDYLGRITTPVMLLGADENLSLARNRELFFRFIHSQVAEVSIRNAIHEDAQYPSHDAQTTEEHQISFASAMTVSALSLAATGKLDYAWTSFGNALKDGTLFNPKNK